MLFTLQEKLYFAREVAPQCNKCGEASQCKEYPIGNKKRKNNIFACM